MAWSMVALFVLSGCIENKIHTQPEDVAAVGSCHMDGMPSITGHTPYSSTILDVIGSVPLEAWVLDDTAASDELDVRWSLNGTVIASATADSEGYAIGDWPGIRPAGDLLLDLMVTDPCDHTAEVQIPVCQQAGYDTDDLDVADWHLEGAASLLDDGSIELTGTQLWQAGSAFRTDEVVRGDDVHIRFEFQTGGGNGADGLSLTALDLDRADVYLGGAGCGLGYGGDTSCDDLAVDPALPGWSLELDTWFNPDIDPTIKDHIAFTFDGQVASPEAFAPVLELEESGWHQVEVLVRGGQVQVTVDGTRYIDEAIDGYYDFPAHIGFTAATGGETNNHNVRGLVVTEVICEGFEPDMGIPWDGGIEDETGEVTWTEVSSAEWGDGYCMDVTVVNGTSAPVEWELTLTPEGTVYEVYDAEWLDDGSGEVVFTGVDWNRVLDTGEQTVFVYCANR